MDVDGLSSIVIGTSDLELSLRLYRDALGMSVIADDTARGDAVERFYDLPPGAGVQRVLLAQQDVRYGMVQLLDVGAAATGRVQEGATAVDHGHIKTLDVFQRAPRPTPMDHFSFVEPIDRLGERIVVAVTDAADRWHEASLGEAFGVFDRDVLHATIRVMDKAAADGPAIMQRLLQGIEHEARVRRT